MARIENAGTEWLVIGEIGIIAGFDSLLDAEDFLNEADEWEEIMTGGVKDEGSNS